MTHTRHTILVVDDEPANRTKLMRTLAGQYTVLEADSGESAFEIARREPVDLIITDQRMPRMTGVELLRQVLRIKPDVMRIVLTGYTDVEDLIQAINDGHVYRYLTKPWEPGELRLAVRQALEKLELARENVRLTEELRKANERLQAENRVLRDEVRRYVPGDTVIHRSPAMAAVLEAAGRVAGADSTVLISGETGTGKEVVARFLHRASHRAQAMFVAVNCGAIPRELAESEFFGHRKGAFSGATADKKGYFALAEGGTLFLDEIGEAPPELQVKLLRALQEREIWPVGAERPIRVNVRVVASTNRDLQAEVTAGRFRQDLMYRLNVFRLHVPPLRNRPEDIPALVAHFLERLRGRLNRRLAEPDPTLLKRLERHPWPGNVRQLENEVERLALLADEAGRLPQDDPAGLTPETDGGPAGPDRPDRFAEDPFADGRGIKDHLANLERQLITEALARTDGNRTHAANLLGITRQSLLERITRHNLK